MSERSIAIIGDGKMGQAIRQLAAEKGWNVAAMLGERESANGGGITASSLGNADVAVEFTQPDAAVANVTASLRAGVPVVVGTTGWYDSLGEVTRVAKETGTGLLWSPNFSLGVNVLIELARYAGTLMQPLEGFDAHIVETHHSRKKDAPSGTAIAIGKAASDALDRPIRRRASERLRARHSRADIRRRVRTAGADSPGPRSPSVRGRRAPGGELAHREEGRVHDARRAESARAAIAA